MINFSKYFSNDVKNTLRVQNGVNFSYKGPWVPMLSESTKLDEWYVGDFMAAEYTIVIDLSNTAKEMIKALVVAGPTSATVTVYGRTSTTIPLLDVFAAVDNSKVTITVSPLVSIDGSTSDVSSVALGGKVIYSANYYHTLNALTPF